jgi:hypothetical protein
MGAFNVMNYDGAAKSFLDEILTFESVPEPQIRESAPSRCRGHPNIKVSLQS